MFGFFRAWVRRARRWFDASSAVPRPVAQTRVQLPSATPQNGLVLHALRQIDDRLDYYVQPNGGILLLVYEPEKERAHRGRLMVGRGILTVDAQLMAEGFSLLDELEPWALGSGRLVWRARQALSATPAQVEAAHREVLAEADGTAAEERFAVRARDRMGGEGRSDHAIIFRHRKSFSYN